MPTKIIGLISVFATASVSGSSCVRSRLQVLGGGGEGGGARRGCVGQRVDGKTKRLGHLIFLPLLLHITPCVVHVCAFLQTTMGSLLFRNADQAMFSYRFISISFCSGGPVVNQVLAVGVIEKELFCPSGISPVINDPWSQGCELLFTRNHRHTA